MSFFSRFRFCQWKALSVCTQWEEVADTLLAVKTISQAPQKDGSGGLRERSLLCDHGSDVLARCPARQGAPANSGNKCEDKKKKKKSRRAHSHRVGFAHALTQQRSGCCTKHVVVSISATRLCHSTKLQLPGAAQLTFFFPITKQALRRYCSYFHVDPRQTCSFIYYEQASCSSGVFLATTRTLRS